MTVASSKSKFFGRIFRRSSERFDPATLEVEEIDVDEVYGRLGLSEKAKKNGMNEIPPTDATVHDGPEAEIITEVEGKIRNGIAASAIKIKGHNDSAARVDTADRLKKIKAVSTDLRDDLEGELARGQLPLVSAKDAYLNAQNEFKRFKRDRLIERDPNYPESYLLKRSLLFFIFVMCCVLNAGFFREALPTGLAGGVVYAAICGFVDIAVSWSLGRAAPWHSLPSGWHKRLGIAAIVGFAIWAPLWNLSVAHLREQAQVVAAIDAPGSISAMNDAAVRAVDALKSNPLGLDDLLSWVFFILGLFLSSVSFVGGLKWDDPIPGYGDIHRRMLERRDDYGHEYEDLKERSEELRRQALEQLEHQEKQVPKGTQTLTEIINTKKIAQTNLMHYVDHQEQKCHAIISRYRDENRTHRETPVPNYFNETWEYPRERDVQLDLELDQDQTNLANEENIALEIGPAATSERRKITEIVGHFRKQLTEIADPLESMNTEAH